MFPRTCATIAENLETLIINFEEDVKGQARTSSILVMTNMASTWLVGVMPGRIAISVEPPLLADLLAQRLAGRSWVVFRDPNGNRDNGGHFDVVLYTGHLPAGLRAPVTMRLSGETVSPVTVRRRPLRSRSVTVDDLNGLLVLIEREIHHAPR